MMNFRKARFNKHGGIDCEIEHPVLGWIPFTADPSDDAPTGPAVYEKAKAVATPYVPEPYVPPSREQQEYNRQAAYTKEADPLFFKWHAGEAIKEEWEAKRAEIRGRFPYPEE